MCHTNKRGNMKASELRKQFKEITGFPLIRANAEVFVPAVGDLRRVQNLEIVVEAAVATHSGSSTSSTQLSDLGNENKELKSTIAELESELSKTEGAIAELETVLDEKDETIAKMQSQIEDLKNQGFTAVSEVEAIAIACVEVSESMAEEIVSAVLYHDTSNVKALYRQLAIALHPDKTRLNKEKASRCFNIVTRIYKLISQRSEGDYNAKRPEQFSKDGSQDFVSSKEVSDILDSIL